MHTIVTRPSNSSLIQLRILMTVDEAHNLADKLRSEVQDLSIFLADKDEDEPDQYNRGEINDD